MSDWMREEMNQLTFISGLRGNSELVTEEGIKNLLKTMESGTDRVLSAAWSAVQYLLKERRDVFEKIADELKIRLPTVEEYNMKRTITYILETLGYKI